jgi:type I restriction enzyme S subunit
MSSEDQGAMSEQTNEKGALVPRLRFPEFRDAGEWATFELGSLSQLVTERVGTTTCTPYTITSGVGLVSQEEKLGRTIAGNSLKNYIVLQRNDFAYNKSATKAYPQGFIALYAGDDRAAVPNSIFTCFRVNRNQVIPAFLDKLFSFNLHGKWLRTRIAVGARAHGSLQVSDDDLMAIPVPLPSSSQSLAEQQKIADCLTSLDELIAAESQKLTTLKTHKKGLMQQLFPREGETVPRLRFPEFREAGEWRKGKLGAIANLYKGKGISKADIVPNGAQPCIRYGELYTIYGEVIHNVASSANANASELFLSKKNDVIIPASGETKIDIAKAACVMHDDIALGGDLNVIRSNQNGVFLSYQLNGPLRLTIARVAQGDTVVHLYPTQIEQLDVLFPNPVEQKKIADCLSSLDDLINAQTQKIDALKTHKKGLMQQLFPVLDEVQP